MKGITRPIDNLGRVVIPKELRRSYGLESDNIVEIYPDGDDKLAIRIIQPSCAICNGKADLIKVKDKYICFNCRSDIMSIH